MALKDKILSGIGRTTETFFPTSVDKDNEVENVTDVVENKISNANKSSFGRGARNSNKYDDYLKYGRN